MTREDPSPAEDSRPAPSWKRALKLVEWAVTAALLVFVAVRLGPQLGALTGISFAPEPAPAYEFLSLDGDMIRSEDLAGRVVVLNFWATWCGPCKLEMPSLQKLHERRADDGVVVLGLSTDAGREAGIRAFLADRQITYPVGRATQAHRRAFGGIPGIPTTFIIDRSGSVRHKVVGYFAPPAMNAAVSRLLEEPGP
jgi:thiol-disulfide isomerase/thioredoxin